MNKIFRYFFLAIAIGSFVAVCCGAWYQAFICVMSLIAYCVTYKKTSYE